MSSAQERMFSRWADKACIAELTIANYLRENPRLSQQTVDCLSHAMQQVHQMKTELLMALGKSDTCQCDRGAADGDCATRTETYNCAACKGTGKAACTLCGGSGCLSWVKIPKRIISNTCPACDGSGTAYCRACIGTGMVVREVIDDPDTCCDPSLTPNEVAGLSLTRVGKDLMEVIHPEAVGRNTEDTSDGP